MLNNRRMRTSGTISKRHRLNRVCHLLAMILIIVMAAGCGSNSGSGGAVPSSENHETKIESAPESPAAPETSAAAESSAEDEEETGDEVSAEETENAAPAASDPDEMPLYRRLCGKYSRRSGEEEFETIEIGEFGGNLYAFCANAMEYEEDPALEIYSYWAMEIFPETAEELFSGTSDACRAGVMEFSNMSNAGRYWSAPSVGTIRYEDGNLVFEDFDSGLPFGDGSSKLVFEPDERVPDTFPYTNTDETLPADEFAGFWREKDAGVPVFLEFREDHNLRIWQKDPAAELVFGCGGYQLSEDGVMECRYNFLGSGEMPAILSPGLELNGNTLILDPGPEYDELEMFGRSGELVFERIKEDEVPLLLLEDILDAGWGEYDPSDIWDDVPEFDLADAYMDLLFRYKKAQDEAYSQEQVEAEGLRTELVQRAWPWAASNDEVKYQLINIDGVDPYELIITYMDEIIDIYGSDGSRLNYAYGTPYRGEATLYEDGLLEQNYLPSMKSGSTTWYRYDTAMGGFFPAFRVTYDMSGKSTVTHYYTLPYETARDSIVEYREKNGSYPDWMWDPAEEITESEYDKLCSSAEKVDVSGGIKIADFRGL